MQSNAWIMHEAVNVPKIIVMLTSSRKRRTPGNPAGRPEDRPDPAQMRLVARMYYLENKNRAEISDELNLDPRKTSWLLDMARQLGVVRIQIPEPAAEQAAAKLRTRYPHLQRVLVVPTPVAADQGKPTPERMREEYLKLLPAFGALAADYFDELVKHNPRGRPFHVGVTGGNQLLEFALAVPQANREEVYIHTTALFGSGRLQREASPLHPIVTASVLWSRCGSLRDHCEYATVSPYDSAGPTPDASKIVETEIKKLETNQTVIDVIDRMKDIEVVFGGIGIINPANADKDFRYRLSVTGVLQNLVTPETLATQGLVGDFSCCPYDTEGCRGDKKKYPWRLFLTAGHFSEHWGIEFFKRMVATPGKKVVAFGGPYHLPAIKIMLDAQICNVLITDEASARKVAEAD
jgi:DNA-binding transcriptional regulator LsrR (DeoR family)